MRTNGAGDKSCDIQKVATAAQSSLRLKRKHTSSLQVQLRHMWVERHAKILLNFSLESFVDQYEEMREIMLECIIDEDPDDIVPVIDSYKGLKKLCGISSVHIEGIAEDGTPTVGIGFFCNWEDEHGAGTSFQGLELTSIGDIAVAFFHK